MEQKPDSLENQPQSAPAPEIDQEKLEQYLEELRRNQSFSMGIAGGFGAAILGAFIWGVISALTKYQIGYMAVGVGFLVGFAVRIFGKGVDTKFGIAAAGLALFGCMLGNLLTVCIMISFEYKVPIMDLFKILNPELIWVFMKESFQVMDLLFYGIAMYEGFYFGVRKLTDQELASLIKQPPQA